MPYNDEPIGWGFWLWCSILIFIAAVSIGSHFL